MSQQKVVTGFEGYVREKIGANPEWQALCDNLPPRYLGQIIREVGEDRRLNMLIDKAAASMDLETTIKLVITLVEAVKLAYDLREAWSHHKQEKLNEDEFITKARAKMPEMTTGDEAALRKLYQEEFC